MSIKSDTDLRCWNYLRLRETSLEARLCRIILEQKDKVTLMGIEKV